MKRFLSILSIALLCTGCSFFQPVESPKADPTPQLDLNQVLADATKKTLDITGGSLDNTFDITFQGSPQTIDRFTANMKGNWNNAEKKSLIETSLNFDLQNPNDQEIPTHGTAKITLATDNKKRMIRLNGVNLSGEESEPINKVLQTMMSQWFIVPANTTYPLNFLSPALEDSSGTNKELFGKSEYFQILDSSLVQMNEEQAYHLLVTLNKNGAKAILKKLQENDPQNIPLERLKDWENIVDNATFQGDIFIGKESGFIRKLQGELTILGSKNNNQQITIALDITLQNINEHVPIAVPKTEKTIDFQSLFSIPSLSPQP